ncbi:MAG: barstar family protein [Cyanobacteria bacterium P01_G01_bin.4]
MIVSLAQIDCKNIQDWESLHDEFDRVFGFPEFYGRNMNAWIDCMSSLAEPDDALTQIHCPPGGVITIELDRAREFKSRYPEQYLAILEGAAFVNWRLIEIGQHPVLALSFNA